VAKREELEALFKTVTDKWGAVDVLVNNAGRHWVCAAMYGSRKLCMCCHNVGVK
jgi:NADP-dependent 3-hydroxy acid dehydrogenase YdfG